MKLRPYQIEVARAVTQSILDNKGITFSVEIARQGGKNELSAHLEVLLLTMYMAKGGSAVKCSPTFKPQTIISMTRLKERLDDFGFSGIWATEMGYCIRLGSARQVFLSAEERHLPWWDTLPIYYWKSMKRRTSAKINTARSSGPWLPLIIPPLFIMAPPGMTALY